MMGFGAGDTVRRFRRTGLEGSALIALVILFSGVTLLWLQLDNSPPTWDEASYLSASLNLFDALIDHGLAGYCNRFLSVLDMKAPLVSALATPIYLVFGRHYRNAYLLNVLFTPVLLLSLHGIAIQVWNRRVALLAVFIAGTMPLLYGLAHWYMVEYALTAAVTLFIWLMLKFGHTKQIRFALAGGVVAGLGMLLKVTFPLYVAAPFLVIAAWSVGARAFTRRSSLALALPVILLPLPWYVVNWEKTLRHGINAAYSSEVAARYGTGPVLSLATLAAYGKLAAQSISPYYLWVGVALIGWAALLSLTARQFSFQKPGLLLIIAWISTAVVFAFAVNKDVRLIAPLLPSIALLIAALADAVCRSRPRWGSLLLAAFVIYPIVAMYANLFRRNARAIPYVQMYDKTRWPHAEIVAALNAPGIFDSPGDKLAVVATDLQNINAENLRLAATELRLPLQIASSAWQGTNELPNVATISRFLYVEGGPDEPDSNTSGKALTKMIRENPRFTELGVKFELPGRGVVRILANSLSDPRDNSMLRAAGFTVRKPDELKPASVDFGDMVTLTGLCLTRTGNKVRVSYRWQCTRTPDREYLCFTHLLNERDKVIAYLDHAITNGRPPMLHWAPGDTAVETAEIELAPGSAETVLRAKVGLYYPPSGDQLPVRHASIDGRSVPLADQDTAVVIEPWVP